jgi:hypothetical protein
VGCGPYAAYISIELGLSMFGRRTFLVSQIWGGPTTDASQCILLNNKHANCFGSPITTPLGRMLRCDHPGARSGNLPRNILATTSRCEQHT